jgi:hypothetical protein
VLRGAERLEDGGIEIPCRGCGSAVLVLRVVGDNGQVHVLLDAGQRELDGLWRTGGGPVFDGQEESQALAVQGKGGIDPGEEVSGASEGLASVDGAAVFAGVVDDGDGEVVLPLKLA